MSIARSIAEFGRELVRWNPSEVERFDPTFQSWVDSFMQYQGQIYQPNYTTTYAGQKAEPVTSTFLGYATGMYKANGIIFAVSMARARLFSEARFKFRKRGTIGGGNDLFGNKDLEILERPWRNGTTQDLLMRAEQDVTCAGTFFVIRESGLDGRDRLRRLRPDWTQFILTAPPDQAVQSDVVGIMHTVGGINSGGETTFYTLDEFAWWAPIPDPDALFRGMSWLTPIVEEMQADGMATRHKLKFFENAATPNLSVSIKDSVSPQKFAQFVRQMKEATVGVENAYKTLYSGGGADVRVIGADMRQLDFRATQGAGETRVAAAGGVPPIIVGLSEGLAAATYSNYGQARRAFGDTWGSNQWRSFCSAISPVVDVPDDAELWYDTRDIPFLREDVKDLAEVMSVNAATVNGLIAAGWTPESAVSAVLAEDFSVLVHSGLMSVQLQPPGAEQEPTAESDPSVARHLPGKHDQGSHGNRFKVPGDKSSGLSRQGRAKKALKASEPEPTAVPDEPISPVIKTEDRIKDTVSSLVSREGDYVMLSTIRTQLADVSRKDMDSALMKLVRDPNVSLIPESNQKVLQPHERDGAIKVGNQDRHLIAVKTPLDTGARERIEYDGVDSASDKDLEMALKDPSTSSFLYTQIRSEQKKRVQGRDGRG